MQPDFDRIAVTEPLCADRIGLARLAKLAFDGKDLRPMWRNLITKLLDGTADAGEGLDLSLIAQLLGDKQAGLAIETPSQKFVGGIDIQPPENRQENRGNDDQHNRHSKINLHKSKSSEVSLPRGR